MSPSPAPSLAAAPPLPFPGTGFVVGHDEDVFLGTGWHEREVRGTDGTPYRGVTEWALFRLRVPADLPVDSGLRLKLLLTAPVPMLGGRYSGEVYAGDRRIGTLSADTDNWVVRRVELPWPLPLDADGAVSLGLRSLTSWVPAQAIPGSRDQRRIACYVAAAMLEVAHEDAGHGA